MDEKLGGLFNPKEYILNGARQAMRELEPFNIKAKLGIRPDQAPIFESYLTAYLVRKLGADRAELINPSTQVSQRRGVADGVLAGYDSIATQAADEYFKQGNVMAEKTANDLGYAQLHVFSGGAISIEELQEAILPDDPRVKPLIERASETIRAQDLKLAANLVSTAYVVAKKDRKHEKAKMKELVENAIESGRTNLSIRFEQKKK